MTSDTRFLLVDEQTLRDDFAKDPAQATSFLEFHSLKDVRLLHVAPSIAATLAANLASRDIGVFGWKFVVFFHPPTISDGQNYRVVLKTLDRRLSARIGKYLLDLNQHVR